MKTQPRGETSKSLPDSLTCILGYIGNWALNDPCRIVFIVEECGPDAVMMGITDEPTSDRA